VKVLLADDDAHRAGAVARVIEADPGLTVQRPRQGQSLADAAAELTPDIVVLAMTCPDRNALEGIRQAASASPHPVALFVGEDDPGFMEEAIGAGVSSYTVLAAPPADVKPILRAAVALFRRQQKAQDRLRDAETRLRERLLIDRAKAILISQRRMTEPDAYRWLRRQAMRQGRRIVEVADALIRETAGTA
jgi:response regulator NasT